MKQKGPIFGEEEHVSLFFEPLMRIAKNQNMVKPGSFEVFFVRSAFESAANHTHSEDDEVAGILFGWAFVDEQGAPYVVVSDSIELRPREKTPVHFAVPADEVRSGCMRMAAITGLSLMVVGWYHSQPGWGVRLSHGDHGDEFTTRFVFNLPWQIALVFDPLNKENAIYYGPDSRPLQKWAFLETPPVEVEMASRYTRLNDLLATKSYNEALVEVWILGQRFSREYANGKLVQWGNGYRDIAAMVCMLCDSIAIQGAGVAPDNPLVESVLASVQKILPAEDVHRVKTAITHLPEQILLSTFEKAKEQLKLQERNNQKTISIRQDNLQTEPDVTSHTKDNGATVPDQRKTKLRDSLIRQADLARRDEKNWDVVRRLANDLLELDPDNTEVQTLLAEAARNLTPPRHKSRRR